MESIRIYNDLLVSIDIADKILEIAKDNLSKIDEFYRMHSCEGVPSSKTGRTSYVDADTINGTKSELRYDILDNVIKEQRQYESMKYLQEEILLNLKKTKEEIELNLSKLEGLHERVYYLHYVKGITFAKIAEELGYSEIHILRKNYELKKMIGK